MPAIIFISRCFEILPTSSVQLRNDRMADFSYCMMQVKICRNYYLKWWSKYLSFKKTVT